MVSPILSIKNINIAEKSSHKKKISSGDTMYTPLPILSKRKIETNVPSPIRLIKITDEESDDEFDKLQSMLVFICHIHL